MHPGARAEMARCQPSKGREEGRVLDLHGGREGATGAMTINSSFPLSPLADATAAICLLGPACASFALAMIRGLQTQNPFRLNSAFLPSFLPSERRRRLPECVHEEGIRILCGNAIFQALQNPAPERAGGRPNMDIICKARTQNHEFPSMDDAGLAISLVSK